MKEPLIQKEIDPKPEKRLSNVERIVGKYYLLLASIGGILFGSNNYIADYSIKLIDSYRVFCLTGFGMLTFFFGYHTYKALKLFKQKGYPWSRKDSFYFISAEDGSYYLDYSILRLMLLRSASSLVA